MNTQRVISIQQLITLFFAPVERQVPDFDKSCAGRTAPSKHAPQIPLCTVVFGFDTRDPCVESVPYSRGEAKTILLTTHNFRADRRNLCGRCLQQKRDRGLNSPHRGAKLDSGSITRINNLSAHQELKVTRES
ncbi:hypothetical protein Plim_0303 [Planctopirus limnophila DSM 3776]|uniref:Uncharacterized protein n=1 Tax=Planctopirus limnophila (strain ATCC 43296 / DSM 3776 / IFAM 1008 / Mu 290) TaxID=521674 RepID=D5SNZ9_PLAL2|nr:hypothetical protein Plim_0303 [Planctopirus limnophila DSM 3776]